MKINHLKTDFIKSSEQVTQEKPEKLSYGGRKILSLGKEIGANHAIVMNILYLADKIFLAASLYFNLNIQSKEIERSIKALRDATFDSYKIFDTSKAILYWIPFQSDTKSSRIDKFNKACFSITATASALKILHTRSIINLSQISLTIGTSYPLLIFLLKRHLGQTLNITGKTAQIISFGQTGFSTIQAGFNCYQNKHKANQIEVNDKFKTALISLLSEGAALTIEFLPLVMSITPLTLTTLAIVAKGTGLYLKLRKKIHVEMPIHSHLIKPVKRKRSLKPSEIKQLKNAKKKQQASYSRLNFGSTI